MTEYPEISLNDLPRYSQVPSRILDQVVSQVKAKTPVEVTREFDLEKWQEVRNWIDAEPSIRYTEVDARRLGHIGPQPFFQNSRFYLLPLVEAHAQHVALCASAMSAYAAGATALVELGAGYGSTILGVHHTAGFPDLPLYAAEYSLVGVGTIRDLARNSGLTITAGKCDFYASAIDNLNIPPGSIIFTSYAAHYVPQLTTGFFRMISALRPAAVFHFEPCLEHYLVDTIHGLMCRRYVQMNDYNRNLVSLLHSQQEQGILEILDERPSVIGANPLLPISVLGWKPKLSAIF